MDGMDGYFGGTQVAEYKVPDVDNVYHLSLNGPDNIWVSDRRGNLVLFDIRRNRQLQTIPTSDETGSEWNGFHTVTNEGDLIFIDTGDTAIKKITRPYNISNNSSSFITSGEWTPISIHSCRSNGDILVGMLYAEKAKVTRYSNTGSEIQTLDLDKIYKYYVNRGNDDRNDVHAPILPHYITENDGYFCISDYYQNIVVVFNLNDLAEEPMFIHESQEPYGVCAYILGQFLVCKKRLSKVEVLTPHKMTRSSLTINLLQSRLRHPRALCWDNENKHLYVGESHTKLVPVIRLFDNSNNPVKAIGTTTADSNSSYRKLRN